MSEAALTEVTEENARLKALLAQTQAALADSEEARRRLEAILADLRREKFGAKSEKLSPDQFSLGAQFTLTMAACNLARLPKLLAA